MCDFAPLLNMVARRQRQTSPTLALIGWKAGHSHFLHTQDSERRLFFNFKKDFIYFQREGKGRRKRGREISMCGCLSCALTGHLACNPGMIPVWESNQRPFDLQPALNPLSYTSKGSDRKLLNRAHWEGKSQFVPSPPPLMGCVNGCQHRPMRGGLQVQTPKDVWNQTVTGDQLSHLHL